MIHILYPPGGFGTTIEYCIRRFSSRFTVPKINVSDDGSMHLFIKEYHPKWTPENGKVSFIGSEISTVIYPNHTAIPADEVVDWFKKNISEQDRVIFVMLGSIEQCIRNKLFMYYKINQGLQMSIFRGANERVPLWDESCSSLEELETWQQRELLSMMCDEMYPQLAAANLKGQDWFNITPDHLLENFVETIKNIITYAGLELVNEEELNKFALEWRQRQQYILDNFALVQNIVSSVTESKNFSWPELKLIDEVLVQFWLADNGYDLNCYNLNEFPKTSSELAKYLSRN